MAAGDHFVKQIKKKLPIEMVRFVIERDFRSSKMVAGSHFVKIIQNK